MTKSAFKPLLPVILLFVILNSFFIAGQSLLNRWNADSNVLLVGNMVLFFITVGSFFMAIRGLKNPNPHAFVRAVYGSIMMKLFLCMIIAFVYIAVMRKGLNKPAFFTCMGLYLVYTFLEVTALTKRLRGKANG